MTRNRYIRKVLEAATRGGLVVPDPEQQPASSIRERFVSDQKRLRAARDRMEQVSRGEVRREKGSS